MKKSSEFTTVRFLPSLPKLPFLCCFRKTPFLEWPTNNLLSKLKAKNALNSLQIFEAVLLDWDSPHWEGIQDTVLRLFSPGIGPPCRTLNPRKHTDTISTSASCLSPSVHLTKKKRFVRTFHAPGGNDTSHCARSSSAPRKSPRLMGSHRAPKDILK